MNRTDTAPPAQGGETAPVVHPHWCTREEPDTEAIHYSARLDCDPDGPGFVAVAVQAMESWPWPPHDDLPPRITLLLTEDGEERPYFLPLSQVRDLIESLQLLLGQVSQP